jgi:integrase
MHKHLHSVLSEWKKILSRHYKGYGDTRPTFVFPSLRNTGYVIPVCDRTITDWVKLAFADIGIAKVKVHPQKDRPDKKAFVEVLESRYKKVITKTFRHFYCTAILNAQQKHPETLTNNYVKGQAGHRDYKTTSMIYGDHLNFDNNREKQQLAIDDAIPIGYSKSIN